MTEHRRTRVWWRFLKRRVGTTLRVWTIRSGLDEGFVVILAAVIGSLAGVTVVGFYGLIDWVRTIAGWARETSGGAGLPWLAFGLVPTGLWLASRLLRPVEHAREMVPALIRANVRHDGYLSVPDVIRKVLAAGLAPLGASVLLGENAHGAFQNRGHEAAIGAQAPEFRADQ